MICASCDRAIDEGAVCAYCDGPVAAPILSSATREREIARRVRMVKGLVLLSILFFFFAPFAMVVATSTLDTARRAQPRDPDLERQLVVLRRIAFVLFVVWGALWSGHFGSILPTHRLFRP